MKIRVKRVDTQAIIPKYQTAHSAGFDLHSIDDMTIEPKSRAIIGTGLAFAIEHGYELQVRPRSGLALKHGVTVLNTPGTIDSDYRGEIKIVLINLGEEKFVIKKGDRVAQAIVKEVIQAAFSEVSELDTTARGEGGFGSTGV